MERETIGDQIAEEVMGGSIIFSPDHTTCGRNCNNTYKVNNYNGALNYIAAHYKEMTEKEMLKNMADQGLITRL